MADNEARSRASQRDRYIVQNMPPIWRRSLTESGMERMTTLVDWIIVGLFVVIFIGGVSAVLAGA